MLESIHIADSDSADSDSDSAHFDSDSRINVLSGESQKLILV